MVLKGSKKAGRKNKQLEPKGSFHLKKIYSYSLKKQKQNLKQISLNFFKIIKNNYWKYICIYKYNPPISAFI